MSSTEKMALFLWRAWYDLSPRPHVSGYFWYFFPFTIKNTIKCASKHSVLESFYHLRKKTLKQWIYYSIPYRVCSNGLYDVWHHRIHKPPFFSNYTKTIGGQLRKKNPLWEPCSWTLAFCAHKRRLLVDGRLKRRKNLRFNNLKIRVYGAWDGSFSNICDPIS